MLTPIHVRAALRAGVAPAALCGVLSAAAPLDRDDAAAYEALAKAPVVEIYGSSETGAIATRRPAIVDRFVPLAGVRLSPGERVLRIDGGHIADVATLPDDAVVADDGTFVLAGRQGDLVKVAGKRASLAALNQALRRIPGVVDGEFVVVPRAGRLASRLGALVVAPSVAPVIILAALREQIDPVFLPRPLLQVDALPRDAVGKVPRDALEQLCVVAAARADAPGGR